jgi:Glycosyltransferase family 87
MRRLLRENALCAFIAGVGCATMAWLSLYGFAWNDYDTEARPAFEALVQGHLLNFLRLAPAYGGSLVERAPFALLPGLWGGGSLAVYRMVALPCLLASGALGVYLVAKLRAEGRSTLTKAVTLGLCVANPVTLYALELGHPEELLGGCLCVAAVLVALRGRPVLAGVLLGLAIANKEWALLATGPVLLALPTGRPRALCLASTLAVAGAVLAPLIVGGDLLASAGAAAAPPADIFQPWQIWWLLGHHGPLVHGLFGAPKPGYRTAPTWAGKVSHSLILLVGALISAILWLRSRRLDAQQAMLALALVLLLRSVLDTWDAVYYPLPFLLALLVWELGESKSKIAGGSTQRPPLLALTCTVLVWASFEWLPAHISPDAQAALFLAWTLPLVGWLSLRLFAGGLPAPAGAEAAQDALSPSGPRGRPQEMTVSSLERLVRTS